MKPKILFIDSNHPRLHEMLLEKGFICDLFYDKSSEELKKLIPNYDGIVIRSKFKITKEIIDNTPNLKLIARAGAGMENIDLVAAKAKMTGITIHYCNADYDEGSIIFQAASKVFETDTAEDIAHKVLKLEHAYYPPTIERVVNL